MDWGSVGWGSVDWGGLTWEVVSGAGLVEAVLVAVGEGTAEVLPVVVVWAKGALSGFRFGSGAGYLSTIGVWTWAKFWERKYAAIFWHR